MLREEGAQVSLALQLFHVLVYLFAVVVYQTSFHGDRLLLDQRSRPLEAVSLCRGILCRAVVIRFSLNGGHIVLLPVVHHERNIGHLLGHLAKHCHCSCLLMNVLGDLQGGLILEVSAFSNGSSLGSNRLCLDHCCTNLSKVR